jgi:site-specific recombinase XerD
MKNNLFIQQLGEYFNLYMPDIRKASKNTIAAYGESFAVFFQFMEEKQRLPHHRITYKHFTAALFDEYILWLNNERGYSASSVRQRMTAITAFLKYASRREIAAINAYSLASGTEVPSAVQNVFPYFSQEEMAILLSLPDSKKYLGSRDLVALSFLYDTGARANELCDACAGDIRFGSPTKVTLHGKGSKTRVVPVSDEVAALLRYHLKTQGLNGLENRAKSLFSSQTHEKMTTACVRSMVEKYVKQAKANYPKLFAEDKYSPHSFRHSKAIHMVESGVNLIYIRNFLGHATVSSTEIYARVSNAAVTKALTERKIPRLAQKPDADKNTSGSLPDFITRARQLT